MRFQQKSNSNVNRQTAQKQRIETKKEEIGTDALMEGSPSGDKISVEGVNED